MWRWTIGVVAVYAGLVAVLSCEGPPPSVDPVDLAMPLAMRFEGLRLEAYQDPAGYWTQGYGRKLVDGEHAPIDTMTALSWLRNDLTASCDDVRSQVTVPLTANQAAALCDFVYNLGAESLRESTLLKDLNTGNYAAVPRQLERWVHAGTKTLPGLVSRRHAEARLWRQD